MYSSAPTQIVGHATMRKQICRIPPPPNFSSTFMYNLFLFIYLFFVCVKVLLKLAHLSNLVILNSGIQNNLSIKLSS